MKKISETIFVCNNCGNEFSKWSGQCGFCKEWNSLKEIKNKSGGIMTGRIRGSARTGEQKQVRNLGEMEGQIQGSARTKEDVLSGIKAKLAENESKFSSCPDCGSPLYAEEGCFKCSNSYCGYSKCS